MISLVNISQACSIFCNGTILKTIQLSNIYNDSKTFVDMPMRFDPDIVSSNFNDLVAGSSADTLNNSQLLSFLNDNFLPSGSDLDSWIPTDYQPNPRILNTITDEKYNSWARDLNDLWLVLGRQVSQNVSLYPQRHSFLPRYNPMIVPGGRFRESYYWDSWFIVRGLLVCEMNQTARYVIDNLLGDINNFGFVPNGGRIYYLDRSQPPVLSEMVFNYIEYSTGKDYTSDLQSFIDYSYSLLQIEYSWWMNTSNSHVVTVKENITLNRYHSLASTPRPESYSEDYPYGESRYQKIRSGAETGWDFSSRWIGGATHSSIDDIDPSDIIPVDLNAILYRYELNLAKLSVLISTPNRTEAAMYLKAAANRYYAINELLWDPALGFWRDYNISSLSYSNNSIAVSSWIPLWANIFPPLKKAPSILYNSFIQSGLNHVGGVLTTNLETGQQWDSPNAWAPLMLFIIEGLENLRTEESIALSNQISQTWLNTCYVAYNNTGYMYEKYNAFEVGVGGGGGEYSPQVGFGWSNGVALVLLDKMFNPQPVTSDDDENNESDRNQALVSIEVGVPIGVVCVLIVLGFYVSYRKNQNYPNHSFDSSINNPILTT